MTTENPKKVLLLFSKKSIDKKETYPQSLIVLLNHLGEKDNTKYFYSYYSDLLHIIDNKNSKIYDLANNFNIEKFDLAYHRKWAGSPEIALASAIYLSKKKVTQLDSEVLLGGSRNKLMQHWRFWENEMPVPLTVFVPRDHVSKWLKNSSKQMLNFPFVMKSTVGARSRDNYLVHNVEEALEILVKYPDMNFLFQKYIENDAYYRVLVCDDRIVMVIKRKSAPSAYKNSASLSTSAQMVDKDVLSKKAQIACVEAAKIFHRDIAGVDIVFDKNNPKNFYFFEVNRSPQIETRLYTEEKAELLNEYFQKLLHKESKS